MPLDIHELLAGVASSRPIFHSEADFQHAFAWELHRQLQEASVRLEKPILANGRSVHLDVLLQHNNATFAIELKYKTRRLTVVSQGEAFSLLSHSAQDIGRYDFIKDINRLEGVTLTAPETTGYAVFLTNDSAYWKVPSTTETVDAAFRMHEGRTLCGEIGWGRGASAGTMHKREKPIQLRGSYVLKWRDFSAPSAGAYGAFRYLAVSVRNGGNPSKLGGDAGKIGN